MTWNQDGGGASYTGMRMILRACLAALLLLACAAPALAQPPQSKHPFPRRKLQQALDDSIRDKRILVVFVAMDFPAHRLVEQHTLTNRTLEAWILWHGVGITLDRAEDPRGYAVLVGREPRRPVSPSGKDPFPTFYFFKDGKLVRKYPDPQFQGFLLEGNALGLPGGGVDPEIFYPKATQILFTADFLMDKLASIDPVWTLLHQEKNPMPEAPPPPPPLSLEDDGLIPPVEDPAPGADPLAILDRARSALRVGGIYEAIACYTWLLERGPGFDPALRAACLSFIAEDAEALARRTPEAGARFVALRDRVGERYLFWQYPDFVEWMALNEIVGDGGENLGLASSLLLDEQEATMLPRAEYAAFRSIIDLDRFTRPREVRADDLTYFHKLARATDAAKPIDAPADEWSEAMAFRRGLVIDYGCRLYAALLLKGREEEAAEIAAAILAKGGNPALARLSLVVTALAAGCPVRGEFAAWAKEAAGMGESRAWLDARLAR